MGREVDSITSSGCYKMCKKLALRIITQFFDVSAAQKIVAPLSLVDESIDGVAPLLFKLASRMTAFLLLLELYK